jgi:hypothetical protein
MQSYHLIATYYILSTSTPGMDYIISSCIINNNCWSLLFEDQRFDKLSEKTLTGVMRSYPGMLSYCLYLFIISAHGADGVHHLTV